MDNLQHDVQFLSGLLDATVSEQSGPQILRLIRELRRLSRERRAQLPGAEERLATRIAALTEAEFRAVVPALIIFFDLANMAEDTQRVRVLRDRERKAGLAPRDESLRAALRALRERGLDDGAIAQLLARLRVELVFTAHPTEAKRRTSRRLIRSLRERLQELAHSDLLDRERERLIAGIRGDLAILYQIDLLRPQRPTVRQEMERGLFFIEELWRVVPQIDRELHAAAAEVLPGSRQPLRPFLKFGSWIGGDRDGNPFVTAAVTADTLQALRLAAIRRHLATAASLYRLLVMSERSVPIAESLRAAIDRARGRWSQVETLLASSVSAERYRQWLRIIEWRLERSLINATDGGAADGSYCNSDELLADVQILADSLRSHNGGIIADGYISEWLAQVQTFGLHFAALDVRQDSRVHVDVLTELFRRAGICDDYAALDESSRRKLLCELMSAPESEALTAASEATDLEPLGRDTLDLFALLATTVAGRGSASLGGHVISMTHELSDVLAVLWFWKRAWRNVAADRPLPHLPIVPLFETIGDLQRSAEVFDAMLGDPVYRQYVESVSGEAAQTIMVGYSDSTKDGGYLAASWWLHQAQERLADIAEQRGIRLIIFHGRGGALGRGGGPAARAILSLPPKAVDGALHVTEQGEVLAERYDDPQIAHRHLEQVSWATLLVSGNAADTPDPAWIRLLEMLAEDSLKHYRGLVEHPEFLAYFDRATPISDIEQLPIGSRPSRRRARRSLADLRAIPWTFAWTQSRHMIPAWYGLGTALNAHAEGNGSDWSLLQNMYDNWPLFRAVIDNAELALAKSDMGIARRYAELADENARPVWESISDEYARSRAAVLLVTRQHELLGGIPWLQRSIRERNPYVDPLNLIQIELIRRLRRMTETEGHAPEAAEKLRELIRLTIQGVAAGLRTTG